MATTTTIISEGFQHSCSPSPCCSYSSSTYLTNVEEVGGIAGEVLNSKVENFHNSQTGILNKLRKYNPILIGGDLFTFGYLGLTIVSLFASGPGLTIALAVCGVTAGVITLGVGGCDFNEGINAWKSGQKNLGLRLMLVGLSEIALGAFLIVSSILAQVAANGALAAFLAANPWFIPLLFLLPTILMFVELGQKMYNLMTHQDLPSTLQLDKFLKDLENYATLQKSKDVSFKEQQEGEAASSEKATLLSPTLDLGDTDDTDNAKKELRDDAANWLSRILGIEIQKTENEEAIKAKILKKMGFEGATDLEPNEIQAILAKFYSQRMEELTEAMGVHAAMDAFKLINPMIELQTALQTGDGEIESLRNLQTGLIELQNKTETWRKVQWARIWIQLLYVIAFGLGTGCMGAPVGSQLYNLLSVATNVTLGGANFIPFILDTFFFTLRNTAFIIPKVELTPEQKNALRSAIGKEIAARVPDKQLSSTEPEACKDVEFEDAQRQDLQAANQLSNAKKAYYCVCRTLNLAPSTHVEKLKQKRNEIYKLALELFEREELKKAGKDLQSTGKILEELINQIPETQITAQNKAALTQLAQQLKTKPQSILESIKNWLLEAFNTDEEITVV